ncbi:hypothetical protein CFN78_25940 [Amycolatopsis antarctica]|uniref:Uncharacterized protein n=1 Tax=Amycolatopsis antarctica TaxID=1854586 RepID=A0A263CW59_9PSEU|nr:hypothetical protein [Amycolatopsis antarctica]OZM70363.1 hypothetical protein CFN78_25940 [Amycolatopsis antarctica]
MTGFHWNATAFTLAADRFSALADDSDGYLYDMLSTPFFEWPNGEFGLLDALFVPHHSLADELAISTGCTPAMLRRIQANLNAVRDQYSASEDAAREDIGRTWDDMGFEYPKEGDAGLEQFGSAGFYFGSDFPEHGYAGSGDFSIQDIVNTILGLPDSVVTTGKFRNPVLQSIWDVTIGQWGELVEMTTKAFTGDWNGVYRAGDALCRAGDYWTGLGELTRNAAGTLFRSWDGAASDSAEWFVEKVCGLYTGAAADIGVCGELYKTHAHGCYLLFVEIESLLTDVPESLGVLFALLDVADKDNVPAAPPLPDLSAIYRVVSELSDALGNIIDKILVIVQIIQAIVGILMSAVSQFALYNNEMRGALD